MTDERAAQRLRQELTKSRQGKGFNRYPSPLRDEAIEYARARRRAGARPVKIAEELGVSVGTVDAWSKRGRLPAAARGSNAVARQSQSAELTLMPVVVRADRPETEHRVVSRLEVDFGDGTRLQAAGITADDLARAIELLRRRA